MDDPNEMNSDEDGDDDVDDNDTSEVQSGPKSDDDYVFENMTRSIWRRRCIFVLF